ADRNRSHWSTSKTPSYTKSVSWQHHPIVKQVTKAIKLIINFHLSMLIIFHYQCYSLKRVTCQQCNDQYIVSIMF
ncbi:hypothetical protein FQ043_00005, partial [Escherichia coli]|nr:hypothetical protein [Escherichia coli]